MEEEVGIKVTRLRRRLSVESDDVKSPSTQSTPTKKRGGRLAAKPQLELIDEHVSESVPKKTRKSTAKEITEPVEEKAGTPARRSTRIKSNTSIVSEMPVDVAEDMGTPARRSTRIKSNTSIVAESVQNLNSPRAKRAARRTSQVGSDNEGPVTPARQTRRTRKDSTSSIDKQADPNSRKLDGQVNKVIIEESENNVKETKNTDSPSVKKSPRLFGNTDGKRFSLDNDGKENQYQNDKNGSPTTNYANKSVAETNADQTNEVIEQKASELTNLSLNSSNLIKELNDTPKKGVNNKNKSTTAIQEPQVKSKRKRTKSWTTISVGPSNENSFCSDSEAYKKKHNSLNLTNMCDSGDGIMNISNKNEKQNQEVINISLNSTLSDKKKKKRHDKSRTVDTEISVHNISELNTPPEDSKDANEEVECLNSSKKQDSSLTKKLFEQAPSGLIQSLVYVDDSDSNNGSIGKGTIDKDFDTGDQCVPVVDHHIKSETSIEEKNNISYEPMDIDETMPENLSLTSFAEKNNSVRYNKEPELEKRKSTINISEVDSSTHTSEGKSAISDMQYLEGDIIDKETNKSQRKSSITVVLDYDAVDKDLNRSNRKLSMSNVVSEDTTDGTRMDNNYSMDKKSYKSKRKSSMTNMVIEDNVYEDSNVSKEKSLSTDVVNNDTMNKGSNKSKRKSSISNIDPDGTNENFHKSIQAVNDESLDKRLNKSRNISSVSGTDAGVSMDKSKSSIAGLSNDSINKRSNKSQRISSISNIANDDNLDKSYNKSKMNSLISHIESQTLNKTGNENKSTREIDVEANVPTDSNDSNKKISKSFDLPSVNTDKETDKKNLSLTYSTSTPLQQKSQRKLGMQINSSIITPNSVRKVEKNNTQNKGQQETSNLSQENVSDSSEEDSEGELLVEKSEMIDDEAEEASDDYESGDSRDEEEKEYEEENEILEKGESLDSEDENEYSDDSDYEKGSFIVSSDAEDNDLLSGSGDDLSVSAEELSMSAKSKKKYNERKIKEQKKASREMFEARHKSNKPDINAKSKSKKNNRQRLDSSSNTEDEVTAHPKPKRRQRIDSSQDISRVQPDADMSLSKKKKKVKRLSDSLCDDNENNEKEITILEANQYDKIDPLTFHIAVKEEPKTPQKVFDISTIAVTNMEDVEEVNVDENLSIMKSNHTSDPLQSSFANDEVDDEEASISENEEITQNYESVLSNLNKVKSKNIKSLDISLNFNKKINQKGIEPIVDQLNLTQVKKSKNKNADLSGTTVEPKKCLTNKNINKVQDKQVNVFSEGSSDSIDMNLLFPEDSNDSDILLVNIDGKNKEANETTQNKDVKDPPDDFIPLKRTAGKTNMLETLDIANKSQNDSILNISNKIKNKRKSSQTEQAKAMDAQVTENVSFFIDTTGTHLDTNKNDGNISIKNSAKKDKQKNNASFAEYVNDDDSNDAPLEVSYHSEKNQSKQDLNTTRDSVETKLDIAAIKTQSESAKKKKKKKNKKGLDSSENVTELSIIENTDGVNENSMNNVDGSAKKKKKSSETQIEQEADIVASAHTVQNLSLGSAKKQKPKTVSENVHKGNEDVINEEEISKKRKRKSSANQTMEEIIVKDDIKLNTSKTLGVSSSTNNQNKKRKVSHNEDVQTQDHDSVTVTQEKDPVEKAKKENKAPQHQDVDEIYEETTKKNKKRKERDDDDGGKISKVLKQNSFDKVHVPRLPANFLKHLDDKPKRDILEAKKSNVISTTSFVVEETKKRRNKPSNYLEESVYLNDDWIQKKQSGSIKNPKVLPFIPTASTSDNGFTTSFRVKIIPQETEFVAQSSDISNFKNDYLLKKRIKKLGTFEMYKRQRNIKISKF